LYCVAIIAKKCAFHETQKTKMKKQKKIGDVTKLQKFRDKNNMLNFFLLVAEELIDSKRGPLKWQCGWQR
jgi:hypothetical protein